MKHGARTASTRAASQDAPCAARSSARVAQVPASGPAAMRARRVPVSHSPAAPAKRMRTRTAGNPAAALRARALPSE